MIGMREPSAVALINSVQVQRLRLRSRLEQSGYMPVLFAGASELLVALRSGKRFDLLLMVEDDFRIWSGLTAVARVLGIPMLLVTDELDGLTHLGPGDDFRASPLFDFSLSTASDFELDIRIQALLQRAREQKRQLDGAGCITVGDYVFLEDVQRVTHRNQEVAMQPRQFGVALELFRNVGSVVPRESLWYLLWGGSAPRDGVRALDVCVANVRRKLDLRAENGFTLRAVYGRGYQLRSVNRPATHHFDGAARPDVLPSSSSSLN